MGGLGGKPTTPTLGGMKPAMTGSGTFAATQAVKPMPEAVKNDISEDTVFQKQLEEEIIKNKNNLDKTTNSIDEIVAEI